MDWGRPVFPIFSDVEPFEVRHQTGIIGKAFENFVKKRSISDDDAGEWRKALTEAANLSGFHWRNYSLITIDDKNKLEMHDLLWDIGWEIIHQQSPEEPSQHTRLWCHEEVLHVLKTYTATQAVKGLALSMPRTDRVCLRNPLSSLLIHMRVRNKVIDAVKEYILQGPSFHLGDNYPHWLTFTSEGSSILFKVPQVSGFTLKGMTFYILYSSNCLDSVVSDFLKVMLLINLTKGIVQLHKRDAITTTYEDEEWQGMIPNFEPGDDVKVILVFGDGFIAKNKTLFLLYGELKEEREGLTLEDQMALLSIDENV
ncbi:hypothetical protein L6164_000287 [Bauhinia variegata]|uniref:Uncharacterized protein n=1 Tax=Bauhinia variegata TaxID=167791 RepID=A0ACB9Q6B5_BAUVA|nr:hypothetical protein L6164_000287 [Bauhinia variegata]